MPAAKHVAVSQSPAQREKETTLTFPEAIRAVIDGHRVTKKEWNNAEIYIAHEEGFLKIRKADGTLHALLVSDGDLLGTDWVVLKTH